MRVKNWAQDTVLLYFNVNTTEGYYIKLQYYVHFYRIVKQLVTPRSVIELSEVDHSAVRI